MDELVEFPHGGWSFLCSAEQLPSGEFQAVVRYRAPPGDDIRTLKIDPHAGGSRAEALERAKAMAMEWAKKRSQ
ncbi:hypothetical protein [Variovorax sp. PAMC26660]|uniref:hypothetical protein n=1 Tax=Variovorax sp. PAMC26660 TaxID=2762322 RepID=UPI00164E9008|nr:hypothetical protein [Variovorax sp. PAMC26660]QNK68080.1 hypothetical protein H7F35_34060 [Variovorax sp. PAMC26660]